MQSFRLEKDSLGEKHIPDESYYGIQTQRALENFHISNLKAHNEFIESYLLIKKTAAIANKKCNVLDKKIADAIISACDEILSGRFIDQFVVDVYQAGAGTSFNMNVNEVIANRALELTGEEKGDYSLINPNDHVNMSQSTNDTYPTAMRIAVLFKLQKLLPTLQKLQSELANKEKEFIDVIKSGRTHLQDATPISLGQEFSGYASVLKKHIETINDSKKYLLELGLGGTAVGTGLNTPTDYRDVVIEELQKLTGMEFKKADNYFEAMQSMFPFVHLSNALANLSLDLIRIANDLRLLSSGPMTGLAEIKLPAVQPGSSIMPGKINPSIAEMLNMVCFQVIGNNTTISLAAQAGQLELNVMMPVINYNLLQTIEILTNAITVFSEKCVKGIEANRERCKNYSEKSISVATLLSPKIGYLKTAELVKEALEKNVTVKKLVIEKGIMTEKDFDALSA
ncbi:MAG: aspartate ammonia-lyase [Bacteroidota bacterium]|nr:aspartate ammonia-lyase [Bacteroidota bacterium]